MHEKGMTMKRRRDLQAIRRINARKAVDIRRGMPSMLPENPAHASPSTMRAGDAIQGTVSFDEHRVLTREQAAREFASQDGVYQTGMIVVLSRCTITTPTGAPFESEADVYIGGSTARDLVLRDPCLSKRAFVIHGRIMRRSDGARSYDLAGFSGTSPRKPAGN
jgi:hypothetical protein